MQSRSGRLGEANEELRQTEESLARVKKQIQMQTSTTEVFRLIDQRKQYQSRLYTLKTELHRMEQSEPVSSGGICYLYSVTTTTKQQTTVRADQPSCAVATLLDQMIGPSDDC